MKSYFSIDVQPDYEGLLRTVKREGNTERVHFIELFLDSEIKTALSERFGINGHLSQKDPRYNEKREIALQRYLGYDFVRCGLENYEFPLNWINIDDTADHSREEGRDFINEHKGPITCWEEYEKYPWPQLTDAHFQAFEWYEKYLPDDMCVIAQSGFGHIAELVTWLMGFETLCFALLENRELVRAISDRVIGLSEQAVKRIVEFEQAKLIWGSDDMGFRSGLMIGPDDTRDFILPGHKLVAEIAHAAGKPYLLHSCGKLDMIIEDLIEDVKIDARHSFEDNIESVVSLHRKYGQRIAHLGGIDMDFLCRSGEEGIRKRVRETLQSCMPIGGYCLGTGNSVANYVPPDNYLAMLDEGRKFM
jgi:uroporphyrinogen decarboxylase